MRSNYLYHGSTTKGIKLFEPRKRFTPGVLGKNVPPAIYATDDPRYAAAHAFSWSSKEGFDTYYEKNNLILEVPKKFQKRLDQKICIYTVPKESFELLKKVEPKGRNYWSLQQVKPLSIKCFNSVRDAFIYYGAIIKIFKPLHQYLHQHLGGLATRSFLLPAFFLTLLTFVFALKHALL